MLRKVTQEDTKHAITWFWVNADFRIACCKLTASLNFFVLPRFERADKPFLLLETYPLKKCTLNWSLRRLRLRFEKQRRAFDRSEVLSKNAFFRKNAILEGWWKLNSYDKKNFTDSGSLWKIPSDFWMVLCFWHIIHSSVRFFTTFSKNQVMGRSC